MENSLTEFSYIDVEKTFCCFCYVIGVIGPDICDPIEAAA